ncbi:MAG: beta-propeller fold lactonase family protein [Candidatus Dactylopiibacterium sp.]|nr:beta-propeller fold lactonase family protein [Candidatus Dactylopiibacterium sp.]
MTLCRIPARASRPLALEARMMFDAAAVATAAAVTVDATDTHPGVTATGASATVIVDEHSTGAAQDLFSDVSVSADHGNQELTELVITVDRSGAGQALLIDGSTIALQAFGGAATTSGHAYTYEVAVSGNTTTITLSIESSDAYQPADVARLIDGIAYQVLDNSVAGGTVTVTLKSLGDTGDTTELGIRATVFVDSRINVAPVIADAAIPDLAQSITLAELGSSQEVAYSRDGKYLYAASATGTLVSFTVGEHGELAVAHVLRGVADLGSVADLALSADGKSLYALSGSNIVTLDVAADGSLSGARSTSAGGAVRNLALSDDGAQLYVSTQYGGMTVFNRDAASGSLTQIQRLDEGAVGGGRTRTLYSTGDYVFVASGTSLVTFQRNDNGTLAKLDFGTLATGIPTGTTPSLAASADGSVVFIGDGSTIRVYALRDAGQGPELLALGSHALAGVSALAVSADGRTLYATSSAGTLSVYAIGANGALTLGATLRDVGGAAALALSADGTDIVVAGASLSRFSALTTSITGTEIALARDLGLSDANLDLLGGGAGDYGGASVSIARAGGASADDVFGFLPGNGLTLSGNQIVRDGVLLATLTQAGGTLTLSFAAGASRADANAALRQLSYRNAGSPADGTLVTLNVTAHDGALASQVATLTLLMTTNTAPSLTASVPARPAYDTSAQVVTLFANAAVNTGEAGQAIIAMTLRVDGLESVANEFLLIDGTRIDLSRDGSGSTTGGHAWSYTLAGGVGTLSLTQASGMGLAAAQALVNGIGYVNDSPQATSGTRSVTITQLSDNGGTGGGGQDTAAPGITASIALAINNAPQLDIDIAEPDPTLLHADGTLSGYGEYVTDIVVSADGRTVFISGSSAANAAGTSTLRVYARDTASGALTLLQTFTQGLADDPATSAIEVDGLNGISAMAMHGDTLYVAGYGTGGSASAYALLCFTQDASGRLNFTGVVASQGVGGAAGLDAQVSEIVISADGRSLYTINGVTAIDGATGKSVLAQFSRDTTTGALAYLGAYTGGSADLGMNGPSGIAVSPDGGSVYVANRSNSMLTVFSRDAVSGVLTYKGFVNAASIAADPDSGAQPADNRYLLELQDVVIAPDGAYVYVGSGQQATLTVFRRDAGDGSLTYVGTLDLYTTGLTPANALAIRELAVSADGTALYAGMQGGQLIVFSRDAATGTLSHAGTVNAGLRTNQIAVTPDGLNLYSGRSQSTTGVAVLSALPSAAYRAGGEATPFAQGIGFSDVDHDATGDYAGTTLTLVRAAGASSDDVFGFRAGNGLSLQDGHIVRDGVVVADFRAAAGSLGITFAAGVDKATANQVLQQVSYRNGNAEAPARVDLKLVVSDGGKSVETLFVLLRAVVPAEPVLAATGKDTRITLGTGGLPGAVDLFDGVEIQPGSAGGALAQLTIAVDRSGAGQALVIAGRTIPLVATDGVQAGPAGYLYQVETGATGSTIRLWLEDGDTAPASVAALIDGMAYEVLDGELPEGVVTVTLASLVDADGQEGTPGMAARVTLVDARQAPTLGAETGALLLDGKLVLVGDDGYTNLLEGVRDVLSVGEQVYVLRTTTQWNYDEASGESSETAIGTLYVFQRAADGSLSLRDTLADTPANALASGLELGLAADGGTLLVVGSTGVTLFARDTASGALSFAGSLGAGAGTAGDGLAMRGDSLYLSTAEGVTVFQRENGAWTQREVEAAPGGDEGVRFTALRLSADGAFLFAAAQGGETLASVFRVNPDGTLTRVADATDPGGEHYGNGLALSADGSTLYVAESGWLHAFGVGADGSLARQGQALALEATTIRQIIVSPDGAAVIVAGEADGGGRLELFTRDAEGALTARQRLDAFGSMDDWDNYVSLREIRAVALSADGTRLYLVGAFMDEGLLIVDLAPAGAHFIEDAGPVALLPGGTLADAQLDALGSYRGASLSVTREGGAVPGDVFTFLDGAGLSLRDGQILRGDSAVASFTVEGNGQLVIVFTGEVTQAEARQILRRIAFDSTSQDPAASSERANFSIVLDDGDGHRATQRATVLLEGRNDAAVVEAAALAPTFHAGGEAVKLFDGTRIDTVEAGQEVWKIIVTLDAIDPDDVLGVGDEQISLREIISGAQTTPGGQQYVVVVDAAAGTTALHLFVNGTPQEAAALVDSLSYRHAGEAPQGTRQIGLQVVESVAWNHPAPDNATTALAAQARVTLAPAAPTTGTPEPGVTATGAAAGLVLGSGPLPDAVDLFSDVTVLPGNDGEPLTTLLITVSRSGTDQALRLDGSDIPLQAVELARTSATGYAYSVEIGADGTATIRVHLDSAANDPADVARLIDALAYKALSATLGEGEVSVKLTGISDYDDATLDVGATIRVSHEAAPPANHAPVAGGTDYAFASATADAAYSATLPAGLFSDPDGDVLAWRIAGLPDGLAFDAATRTLSGTPRAAGAFTLEVSVTDPSGERATRSFALRIEPAAETPNHAPVASAETYQPASATAGAAYRVTLPAGLFSDADGDALAWQVTGLPDGLAFDAATRTLSGTPAGAGEFALTVTVTDPAGLSASRVVTLGVAAAPVAPPDAPPAAPAGALPGSYFDAAWRLDGPDLPARDASPVRPGSDSADGVAPAWGEEAPPPAMADSAALALGQVAKDARGTLALLDALAARAADEAAQTALPLADGRDSPLVHRAAPDAPRLSASVAALRGHWQADVAGNRQVFALPAGVFRSHEAVAGLSLRMADGRPLPASVRLDVERGLIVRAGLHGDTRPVLLELRVHTRDGLELAVPLRVEPGEGTAPPATGAGHDAPQAGKEAVSLQLRERATRDLMTQARALLAALGAGPASATSDVSLSGSAAPRAAAPSVSAESPTTP